MPFDPTEVRSRDELLMGAIATGDSTVIGDPRDRNEEFIKAIADGIGSAGGTFYVHQLSTSVTIDGNTCALYVDIINKDSTPISSVQRLHDNLKYIMSINGECVGTGFLIIPYSIQTSANRVKLYYSKLSQDADTKVITSAIANLQLSTTLTLVDGVTAI